MLYITKSSGRVSRGSHPMETKGMIKPFIDLYLKKSDDVT